MKERNKWASSTQSMSEREREREREREVNSYGWVRRPQRQ